MRSRSTLLPAIYLDVRNVPHEIHLALHDNDLIPLAADPLDQTIGDWDEAGYGQHLCVSAGIFGEVWFDSATKVNSLTAQFPASICFSFGGFGIRIWLRGNGGQQQLLADIESLSTFATAVAEQLRENIPSVARGVLPPVSHHFARSQPDNPVTNSIQL